MKERTILYISDGTAITTESLGNSLLSQFPDIAFKSKIYPYIDSLERAQKLLDKINDKNWSQPPIIFSSLVDEQIRNVFVNSGYPCFDLFSSFIPQLSTCLQTEASPAVHQVHSISDPQRYANRIEAVDYTINCDDGLGLKHYPGADVILIGVSRSGKTPTCLYMGLNFGILAANYPFTEEDFTHAGLPDALKPYQDKLFGLTVDSERLAHIRQARRANSPYAQLDQCKKEVRYMQKLYQDFNIPWLDATNRSIEEITTLIMSKMKLKRR
jgi:regulator of PEP synthase PpsR (kinase-PPPase family)